jgi:DNA-binding HxlR family transcriptional regulator
VLLDWRSTQDALEFIRGRWTLPIIAALEDGPLRHNDLLRVVGDRISEKVFDETLARLAARGVVVRHVDSGSNPPAVSYELTPVAASMFGPLADLAAWTREHRSALVQRRRSNAEDR